MPEMNGYEFYSKIADNMLWNAIPFIFLTAKTEVEDIRFAKKLGVDDYITKPFKEEDLLASITGKINRINKNKLFHQKVSEKLTPILTNTIPKILNDKLYDDKKKNSIFLLLIVWDDKIGPTLKSSYPDQKNTSFSLDSIGDQLFNASTALYGQNNEYNAQGLLLRMSNIKMDAYIYFDSINGAKVRGGVLQFMLALVAPQIDYLTSLRIKEDFEEISLKIKMKEDCDMAAYWKKFYAILPQKKIEPLIENDLK